MRFSCMLTFAICLSLAVCSQGARIKRDAVVGSGAQKGHSQLTCSDAVNGSVSRTTSWKWWQSSKCKCPLGTVITGDHPECGQSMLRKFVFDALIGKACACKQAPARPKLLAVENYKKAKPEWLHMGEEHDNRYWMMWRLVEIDLDSGELMGTTSWRGTDNEFTTSRGGGGALGWALGMKGGQMYYASQLYRAWGKKAAGNQAEIAGYDLIGHRFAPQAEMSFGLNKVDDTVQKTFSSGPTGLTIYLQGGTVTGIDEGSSGYEHGVKHGWKIVRTNGQTLPCTDPINWNQCGLSGEREDAYYLSWVVQNHTDVEFKMPDLVYDRLQLQSTPTGNTYAAFDSSLAWGWPYKKYQDEIVLSKVGGKAGEHVSFSEISRVRGDGLSGFAVGCSEETSGEEGCSDAMTRIYFYDSSGLSVFDQGEGKVLRISGKLLEEDCEVSHVWVDYNVRPPSEAFVVSQTATSIYDPDYQPHVTIHSVNLATGNFSKVLDIPNARIDNLPGARSGAWVQHGVTKCADYDYYNRVLYLGCGPIVQVSVDNWTVLGRVNPQVPAEVIHSDDSWGWQSTKSYWLSGIGIFSGGESS